MTISTADRKSVRRQEKQAEIRMAQRAAVVRDVMSTTQGREWIWFILSECHIFSTTFTGDALTSAFCEGERNIGQRILNTITDVCPDQYIQAMREAHERSISDTTPERRSSPVADGGNPGREGPSDDGDEAGLNDGDEDNRDDGLDETVHRLSSIYERKPEDRSKTN